MREQNQNRMFCVQHTTGLVADMREDEVRKTVGRLTNFSRAERKRVLKSVDKALE